MKPQSLSLLSVFSLILFSLSSGVMSALAAPTEVVTAYGDEFYLNGKSYCFVGVNLRGVCHYGKGAPLQWTQSGHIDENLSAVAAMGGKVVRLFASCVNAASAETANRLEVVLDKMEPLGLKALVCLTDLYNTGFHPQGDDSFYKDQGNGWTLLDDAWFAGGYQLNYLPQVKRIVAQLKDHNAVFAWELGNELTDIKNPSNIVPFTQAVAAAIKAIDPYHMVSTGFIGVDHLQIGEAAGYALYSDPNIDFISEHTYNGEDHGQNHAVHSRLGKPLVVGEYGWSNGEGVDRPARTAEQLARCFDERAARGFLQWGFQAQAWDIGDGDNIFGMDHYKHDDYDALWTVYSTRAGQIESASHSRPLRLESQGQNVALSSTAWTADSVYSSAWGGDKAFDGTLSGSSKWTSNGDLPPHWLAIDLGREREVDGFTVRMAGAAGERFDYAFKRFRIDSGRSLSGPWTTEFDVDNRPQFSNVHRFYESPQSMRYVRIYITDSGVDNYCRLPEFEVYGIPGIETSAWIVH